MADSLNGSKLWWPTWKLVLMRGHISIIFELQGRLRRKRQWNHPHSQTTDKTSKPKATSYFAPQKLKGTWPIKTPVVRVVHLEGEGPNVEVGTKSEDPDGINGVTEEFIICLARAVKEAQQDEKHCYHCSSTVHFICKCLLVKASRSATHLNWKEGMAPEKRAWTPQVKQPS